MQRTVLGLALVCLVAVVAGPVLAVVFQSLVVEGKFSVQAYQEIASPKTLGLLAFSCGLAITVALATVTIGGVLGFLLARTDLPSRAVWLAAIIVPFVTPPYVFAVGAVHWVPSLVSWWGCALILIVTLLPLPVVLTMAQLRSINPGLEEAGILAASRRRAVFGVTLPMTFPALALSGLLVFVLSLGEFGVPLYLRVNVYPVQAFEQFAAFYNYGAAAAASVPLVLIAVFVNVFQTRLAQTVFHPQPGTSRISGERWSLGRWRVPALMGVLLLALCTSAPVLWILWRGLTPTAMAHALAVSGDAVSRSFMLSVGAATTLSGLGFLLALRFRERFSPWTAGVAMAGFSLPSVVLGIGLAAQWNHRSTNFVYATPAILVLGYLAQFTFITMWANTSAIAAIPGSLSESARVSGAGWLRRTLLIDAPLASKGLVAGWLASFALCVRELGIAIFVHPAGFDTLPIRIFNVMANGTEENIAAHCTLLVLLAMLPFAALFIIGRRSI